MGRGEESQGSGERRGEERRGVRRAEVGCGERRGGCVRRGGAGCAGRGEARCGERRGGV